MRRLIVPDHVRHDVQALVEAAAPAESGCFCLLRTGQGAQGIRLLVGDVLEPPPTRGTTSAATCSRRPRAGSPRWSAPRRTGAAASCLSTPIPTPGIRRASPRPDRVALTALGPVMEQLLGGPFAAAIVHPEGWIAAVNDGEDLFAVDRVQALGRTLRTLDPPEPAVRRIDTADARQADAAPLTRSSANCAWA